MSEEAKLDRAAFSTIKAVEKLNSYDPKPTPRENPDFWGAKSLDQMMECLRKNPEIQVEAKVLGYTPKGKRVFKKMNREAFMSAVKKNRIKESVIRKGIREGWDRDYEGPAAIGYYGEQDFVGLLGGPFNKQPYIYDYLKATMGAFYAFHHDPIGRRIPLVIRDFTLGRDWRLDAKGPDAEKAQLLWDATVEVNKIYEMMDTFAIELSLYGENMIWELPNDDTKIVQDRSFGENVPKGALPRFRLTDPTCIWDIITWPEDITNVLAYQWVAPTQYQMYTHDDATGKRAPTLKFIYQQIPADQMDHYKINCVSNEKRGRSDLYPVLGYLKRLRDSVNYAIIAEQKASAYCLDTTIDGNQADIDNYVSAQEQLGPIPPAGSEFVHSKKIERKYLGTEGANSKGSSDSASFIWTISMISIGTGIPTTYLGAHFAKSETRASAMVATEPVAKLFESRRNVYRSAILNMFNRMCKKFRLNATAEVSFPEIVAQDRSTKLKDLGLAETSRWLSPERVATLASKEFGIRDYDYEEEQAKMAEQTQVMFPDVDNPLTRPGADDLPAEEKPEDSERDGQNPEGLAQKGKLTQDERQDIRKGRGL